VSVVTPVAARMSAPAKINLVLRVLDRREDGFHELRTVFQAIDLADEVQVAWGGNQVQLDVQGADVGPDVENLAYRAATRFLEARGERRGVRIGLVKRIPAGAGLGGGSSDAAAVLRCLAAISPGPADRAALGRIALSLGSDVPFFLGSSPLARATGRGEVLGPLAPLPTAHVVLVLPPVHVSTADAYRALAEARARGPTRANPLPDEEFRSDTGDALPSLERWSDVEAALANDFEPVIAARHPEVRRALTELVASGARGTLLSGSGSACFGFFPDRAGAEAAARYLSASLGWRCGAVRTLTRLPTPMVESETRA